MARHFSNLSGLGLDREGVTKRSVKAHMAALQQQLRDIQEEMRLLTGGGRSQVPTSKGPFQLAAPETARAIDKIEAKQGLRTGTKSQVRHDLVTKKELENRAAASSGSGLMDLLTNQVVASGNKDFGSISFQLSTYDLTPSTSYPVIDLSGATLWRLQPATAAAGNVTIHSFTRPAPDKNMLRIIFWTGYNGNLQLVHNSTTSGVASQGKIDTLAANAAGDVNAPTITTTKTGAFVLVYSIAANRWLVIARSA